VTASDIGRRLALLDVSLFDAVDAGSSHLDRRSLLACQHAVRSRVPTYVYLEIGSHLGGSLQPHVLDPSCAVMHSIDPRPLEQPDARGPRLAYPGNSTERMLSNLDRLSQDARIRIRCYEQSTASLPPTAIDPRPQLCFIDGEHTDDAVTTDFAFCRQVLAPSGGLILFHDAAIIYNALADILKELDEAGEPYRAWALPDVVFAIEFGTMGILDGPELEPVRRDTHLGYLASLRFNDPYRRFFNRWPFAQLRRVVTLATRRSG
jgi:hypothetical protein